MVIGYERICATTFAGAQEDLQAKKISRPEAFPDTIQGLAAPLSLRHFVS